MKKTLGLLFFLSLFLPSLTWAKTETAREEVGDLVLQRTIPDSAPLGQKIWVTINLENKSGVTKSVDLIERLGEADFDQTQAKSTATDYGNEFWYYHWQIKLPAKESTTLSYWLVPKSLGTYTISPARVGIGEEVFYSQSRNIKINCQPDEKCDSKGGENYLTCPADCQTGVEDGICDFTHDNRCDPNCEEGADLDCQAKPARVPPKQTKILILAGAVAFLLGGLGLKIRKGKKIKEKSSN